MQPPSINNAPNGGDITPYLTTADVTLKRRRSSCSLFFDHNILSRDCLVPELAPLGAPAVAE